MEYYGKTYKSPYLEDRKKCKYKKFRRDVSEELKERGILIDLCSLDDLNYFYSTTELTVEEVVDVIEERYLGG